MKYQKGDYVKCIRDFKAATHCLIKGNLYKVSSYVSSSQSGMNGYSGIVRIEKNENGEYDAYSDNYFIKATEEEIVSKKQV